MEASLISPLDIILTLMRRHWDAKEETAAVALAKLAAPFVHPRAQASRAPFDLSEASDDELDAAA
jgi:hypothetical protein